MTNVLHPVFVVIITSSAPKITTFRHQNPNWDLNPIDKRANYLWVFPPYIYWAFIITIQNAYRRRQFKIKPTQRVIESTTIYGEMKFHVIDAMFFSSALISTRSTSGLPLKGDVERYIVHMLNIDNYLFRLFVAVWWQIYKEQNHIGKGRRLITAQHMIWWQYKYQKTQNVVLMKDPSLFFLVAGN